MKVKVLVVGLADAIVNPWAVVVVSLHTLVADVAMSTPWQSDYFAKWAQTLRVECLKKINKVQIMISLYVDARVLISLLEEVDVNEDKESED